MSTINLINAEILDYQQTANYIDGGIYQFGRTIALSITAFIHPTNGGTEASKFKQIDTKEIAHIDEILENGFVDDIAINGQIIKDVKILSYELTTSSESLESHINLLRVNMNLEFTEGFDNTAEFEKADNDNAPHDVYKKIEFIGGDNARYFRSVSETFNFSVNENYEHSFTHAINFNLKRSAALDKDADFVDKAKAIALQAFSYTLNASPKVGYIDERYYDFIRNVKGHGIFSESYDSINNTYAISRSVASKNGAYKDSQRDENWSADFSYDMRTDDSGSVSITENGTIQGRSVIGLTETEKDSTDKNEDTYENAYQGLKVLKRNAYARCQAVYAELIQDKPDWIPGGQEWNQADDIKTKYISFGRNIDRMAGKISYTIAFTNNPKMHNDAIFEYTIQASRNPQNITEVTEDGTISPYDESKNHLFDAKSLYNKFTASADVIERVTPIFDVTKAASSTVPLSYPKDLTSSSFSFPAYGVGLSYSFAYSDDPTLRNETYIRKKETSDSYTMPVAIRSNIIAPNVKETNYDSNQTTEGSKSISTQCIFKRNPASNKINVDHAIYLKTAVDSIVSTLTLETQKKAFVTSPQVGKGDLKWYLSDLSYSYSSDYAFNHDVAMSFIDTKGVAPVALKY